MSNKNYRNILILVLLLGAFLRIYGLGEESFWLDESDTVEYTRFSVPEIIEGTYVDSTLLPEYFGKGAGSAPLYYIMTNYWTEIFGLNEFNLRLISALFGILSIYLIFLVGKELFNEKVGIIGAFILAINHQNIFFSQEARMYSMLVALVLLTMLSMLKALSSNKTKYWVVFVIGNAALLYTHYFSFFILLFEAVYLLIHLQKDKKLFKQMFFSGLGIFLLYLPWIPALFNQLSHGSPIGRFLGGPSISNFVTILIQFNSWISPDIETRAVLSVFNFSGLSVSGWILILSVIIITLLLGFVFISGVFHRKFSDNKIIFLLLWLLIPVLVPFVMSIVLPENAIFSSIMHVLFASPAYYLIAALGISRIGKFLPVFMVLLTVFSVFPLYSYYVNYDKQQIREASDYIIDNRLQSEQVFIHNFNIVLPFKYYHPDLTNVIGIKDVNELQDNMDGTKFWLLLSMEKFSDPQGDIKKYLDSNYVVIQEKEFMDVRVFHYQEP
jgi:uncharacterized membrane protein